MIPLKEIIGKKIKNIIDTGNKYTIILSDNSEIIISQEFCESRNSTIEGDYYTALMYKKTNRNMH